MAAAGVLLLAAPGSALAQAGSATPQRPWLTPGAAAPAADDSPTQEIRGAVIQRTMEKFNLRVAEDIFTPKLRIEGSAVKDRSLSGDATVLSLDPVVSWRVPTGANLTFSWANDYSRPTGALASSATSNFNVRVVQPLLRGAGIDVNLAPVRIARIVETQNKLRLKATASEAITRIVQAYYNVIQSQEAVRIARESLQRARDLIETTRALVEAGRQAANDVVQAEAAAAQKEVALIGAEKSYESARLELVNLLALDPRTRVVATDKVAGDPAHLPLAKAREIAFQNRPDYLVQSLALETADLTLLLARNNRLWDISLIAGWSKERQDFKPADAINGLSAAPATSFVGLQWSIPFGDLTARQGELQATTAATQSKLQLETIRANIEQTLRNIVRDLEVLWKQYQLSVTARELAAKSVEAELVKLRFGRSSNFQVLQLQENLLNAENAELSARVAYANILITLDVQLGMTLDTWGIDLAYDGYDG
jgi:outer membrane protein